MVRYYLSRRQEKELAGGKLLSIAIPHPPEDVGDDGSAEIEQWYRASLSLPPATIVMAARSLRLTVNPIKRSGNGLGVLLGSIVHADSMAVDLWTIEVECVLADICVRRTPRSRYPTQWPAALELDDGRIFPAPQGSDEIP